MQETRYNDGSMTREFVQELKSELLNERLSTMHAKAIQNPDVKSVYQVKIGRNDPCPCNSGKKFKKCCINRIENR